MTKDDIYLLLTYILQMKKKVKIEINYMGRDEHFVVRELNRELKKPEDIK